MGMESISDAVTSRKSPRNWWKIAFFIAIVALELTRELLVLNMGPSVRPSPISYVMTYNDVIAVRGSWTRSDGGADLMPATVTIECRRTTGICIVADAHANDDRLTAPEISQYAATFTPQGVTFSNDDPTCVRYLTRIDVAMKQAFSVRERKPNVKNFDCASVLEDRIEMKISDGYFAPKGADPTGGQFVPILSLLRMLLV